MGKKGHDLSKILRQELVLTIMEKFAGDNGILTTEIYEILDNKCPGINKRTLYRDLGELSLRYPIYDEEIDGKARWFIRSDELQARTNDLFRNYLQKELIHIFSGEEDQITEAV